MHDQMKGAHGQRPVVFAFTVQDAGRKVVDYYMTWRGKVKVRSPPHYAACILVLTTGSLRRLIG